MQFRHWGKEMMESFVVAVMALGLVALFAGGILIQEQRCARCGRICTNVDCC